MFRSSNARHSPFTSAPNKTHTKQKSDFSSSLTVNYFLLWNQEAENDLFWFLPRCWSLKSLGWCVPSFVFRMSFCTWGGKWTFQRYSIVSDYTLGDLGSIPAEAKDFCSSFCVQTSSVAHQVCHPVGPFPGAKRGRGVTLTTQPHLVPRSRISRSYTFSGAGLAQAV
jgi:hypothetical protein